MRSARAACAPAIPFASCASCCLQLPCSSLPAVSSMQITASAVDFAVEKPAEKMHLWYLIGMITVHIQSYE